MALAADLAASKAEAREALADARLKAEEAERAVAVTSRSSEEQAALQADLQDKLSQEVARRAEVDADLRAKADELAGAQAESMRVHEELASLEAELARAKGATKRAVQRKLDAQRANFAAADSQVAEMGYFAAPGQFSVPLLHSPCTTQSSSGSQFCDLENWFCDLGNWFCDLGNRFC